MLCTEMGQPALREHIRARDGDLREALPKRADRIVSQRVGIQTAWLRPGRQWFRHVVHDWVYWTSWRKQPSIPTPATPPCRLVPTRESGRSIVESLQCDDGGMRNVREPMGAPWRGRRRA